MGYSCRKRPPTEVVFEKRTEMMPVLVILYLSAELVVQARQHALGARAAVPCTSLSGNDASLTVTKVVVGGPKVASDFLIGVDDPGPDPSPQVGNVDGTCYVIDQGKYAVTEAAVGSPCSKFFPDQGQDVPKVCIDLVCASEGYAASFSAGCGGEAKRGETLNCSVTNTHIGDPEDTYLTVIKHVVNDNGGTLLASDFTIRVAHPCLASGTSSFPGSESGTQVFVRPGLPYDVTETFVTGYTATFSSECSGVLAIGRKEELHSNKQRHRHADGHGVTKINCFLKVQVGRLLNSFCQVTHESEGGCGLSNVVQSCHFVESEATKLHFFASPFRGRI